jgi:outer membrane protein TolC
VENALVAYANEQDRRQQLVIAVEQNRRAVAISTELYQRGEVEFLDLLNAQRSLLGSEGRARAERRDRRHQPHRALQSPRRRLGYAGAR